MGFLSAAAALAAATDEATSTFATRLARFSALVPLCSGLAVISTLALARVRGELRALAALGAPPWVAGRGAALAGAVIGLLTPLSLLSPWADAESLFPAARSPIGWVIEQDGSARGGPIAMARDGSLTMIREAVASRREEGAAARDALPVLVPLAVAAPFWAAIPMGLALRAGSLFGSVASAVLALHAVAAGRHAAWLGSLAVVPLLLAIAIAQARSKRLRV